jgi:cytosine/adenosine deaminase-related metal-dependent hydrolase
MKNQVGSLEPGQKADLFMINLRRAHLVPSLRVVSAFVHNGQPADIEDVMVDGQWLMREGKVLTISEGDLIRQAEQIGHDVWQRLVQQFPSISLPFSLPPEPLSWACG